MAPDILAITAPPTESARLISLATPSVWSGEVVIDVCAALVPAEPPAASKPPHVPGRLGAGIVADSAHGFAAGDRVAFTSYMRCKVCQGCKARPQRACARVKSIGVVRQGGLATRINVPRTNVVRLPDALDFPDAVAALATYPEALRCLRDGGGVHAGDRVWVEGRETMIGCAMTHLIEQFDAQLANTPALAEPDLPRSTDATIVGRASDGGRDTVRDTDRAAEPEIAMVLVAGAVTDGFGHAIGRLGAEGPVVVAPGAVSAPIRLPPAFFSHPGRRLLTAHVPTQKDAEAVVAWLGTSSFRPKWEGVQLAEVPDVWANGRRREPNDLPLIARVRVD